MTDDEIIATMRNLAADDRLIEAMTAAPWQQRRQWFAAVDAVQVFSDREVDDAIAVLDGDLYAEFPVSPQQVLLMSTRQRHDFLTAVRRNEIRRARQQEREFWTERNAAIPWHGVWTWPEALPTEIEDELREDDTDE